MPTLDPRLRQTADLVRARVDEWGLVPHVLRDVLADPVSGYTARCEHSDAVLDLGRRARPARAPATVPDTCARAFLVRHAAELLDVDVDLRGAPRARGA